MSNRFEVITEVFNPFADLPEAGIVNTHHIQYDGSPDCFRTNLQEAVTDRSTEVTLRSPHEPERVVFDIKFISAANKPPVIDFVPRVKP